MKIAISEVVFDGSIYPRDKPSTTVIEEYADALITGDTFECLGATTKYGTLRHAAEQINCSLSWLWDRLPDSEFIYFIKSIDKIKIGVSHGKRFAGRIQSFHVANPHGLELVCAMYGGKKLERQLHEQFQYCHVCNEWFYATPILAYLKDTSDA